MKQIKRLTTLALAVMLLLSLAIPAFAEDGDVETIEISVVNSESGASVAGHTYNVYQIFTGDVAADGKTLSNVAFGENYKPADKTVDQAMEALAEMSGAEAAAALNADKTGEPVAVLNNENEHKANVVPGYYLIVDVSTNLPEGQTSSAFILQVLEPVAIKSKHSAAPIVEKKIDDTNDSIDATNEIIWHDSADHDIGDHIPFKLEMTVPASIAQFIEYKEAYKFVFHDTEEKGLNYDENAVAYLNDVEIDKAYYTVSSPAEDSHTFDVVFADLTKIPGIKAGDKITVLYTSELTKDAIIGNKGNVNEVYGEYSNLHRPDYPGTTPKDTVIAFTYKVVVNKVDKDKKPLAGAEFTLEKYNKATDAWDAIQKVETTAGTTFTFNGLDDGEYRLTETETPDGYNSIDPIKFTVTADHDIEWNTQGRTDVLNTLTGKVTTGEIKFTESAADGTLSTDVENKAGIELPETGGMGTTIFYALGGMMVLVAIVLLVTKKRMASAE